MPSSNHDEHSILVAEITLFLLQAFKKLTEAALLLAAEGQVTELGGRPLSVSGA